VSAGPVARAVRGGVSRRRVRSVVIGLVLLVSTAASVLALSLVVDSSAPFDHSFAAQHGAHLAASFRTARATPAELAATTRLPQVAAAAGPFAEASVTPLMPGPQGALPPMTLAGRASPGGPVDDITLLSGHWPRAPGQVVLASNPASGYLLDLSPGTKITVTSVPGHPVLTVTGTAISVTDSADGWVTPAEITQLRAPGAPATAQLLYRLRQAGSAASVSAGARAISAALPPGALTATQSYLAVRLSETSQIGPFVPFLIAFGLIGLVMSVLIVANVVSGSVVAGYRRIGILKSIGFTPAQVVAAYTGQVAVPAVAGCLAGLAAGYLLATMLLRQAADAYGVGTLGVPAWVAVTVPLFMLALVGLAAVLPALRAGRLSAVQAIAAGRAPRSGRGYAAHRLLSRFRLPRPVTIGLAAPFARPARTGATLAAVLLGATVVTFSVGLGASLSRVATGLSLAGTEQLEIYPSSPDVPGFTPARQRTLEAALRAQPGTGHYTAESDGPVQVAGLGGQHPVAAFSGPSRWLGYELISGRWYTGPGQIVASTGFLTWTGKSVGDTVTLIGGVRPVPVRIVGQVFDSRDNGISVLTSQRTLAAADPSLAEPSQYDVGLRPGVSTAAYVHGLQRALGPRYSFFVNSRKSMIITLMLGLIGALTLMLALVAALGVLNTVILDTRERVHDLGVFKAIGMTPRQTVAMVVCSVAGPGLVAGILAVPAGVALQHYVLPVMASAANLGVPASILNVYHGPEYAALALAGVVIAMLGALLPAIWAARGRTAVALHAE
jgi:putative ABC transport system permease protein